MARDRGALRTALARDGSTTLLQLAEAEDRELEFARAVAAGLSRDDRRIPCRFLYDEPGSALYERICELPEYYLTRTEAAILGRVAERVSRITGPVTLVELGAGSSPKTSLLLAASARTAGRQPAYVAVDVCEAALRRGLRELSRMLPGLTAVGLVGRYDQAMPLLRAASPMLVLFLGSTMGNLGSSESDAFLASLSRGIGPGDFFLLGLDLVKEAALLEAAYDDAAGITAAFTRNLFARMNRELHAGIDLGAIQHEAAWLPDRRRVEIHARFRRSQTIRVAPLGRSFLVAEGERIRTEVSRKYHHEEIAGWLGRYGFATREVFLDDRGWFALALLQRAPCSDRADGWRSERGRRTRADG